MNEDNSESSEGAVQPDGEDRADHAASASRIDAQRMGPVEEHERIRTLDVLRGLAIFGIFFVNIAVFALPLVEWGDPETLAGAPGSELVAWSFVRVLFEYKFVSLFSLLFGVGLIVQMNRARARGTNFTKRYLWRMSLLAAIGLTHGLLIWYGDILFMYAIIAIVMLLFCEMSARALLSLAALVFLLGWVMLSGFMFVGVVFNEYGTTESPASAEQVDAQVEEVAEVMNAAEAADAQADDRLDRFFAALRRGPEHPDGFMKAEVIAYGEGPFLAAFIIRSFMFAAMIVFAGVFMGFGLRVVAMFLIGMALMKLGFFDESYRHWHRRLFIGGLLIGLPLELTLIAGWQADGFTLGWLAAAGESAHYLGSFALCLGYIGGICLLVSSGALTLVQKALAAVGRMALTNYLMQSIIATWIFYWWGLGLFGEVPRTGQLGIVASVLLFQVVFSLIWLSLFQFGPLEWIWRSLTYMRPQPLLRRR